MTQSPTPTAAADRFFADLADAAVLGGKARSLARLAAQGLRTPAGFVVTDALFRALAAPPTHAPGNGEARQHAVDTQPWPADFPAALADRLAALHTESFSVRSSFANEDEPGQVAAGIYESRIAVAAADVPAAVREVLGSALAPAAVAYAQAHGHAVADPPVAVLVHAFVPGDARGGAASGGPGAGPDSLLLDVHAGTLTSAARATIASAIRDLAQRHGPSEIEWVAQGDVVTFVQLRPYAGATAPKAWPGWRDLEPGQSPVDWAWDAAHNPLPLSAAHAALVELVDARCRIGIRQRVLGGYLFWAPGRPGDGSIAPEDLAATVARLTGEIDAGRASMGAQPSVQAALEFFIAHYQPLLGLLPPAMRAARENLRQFIAEHFPDQPTTMPALLAEVESKARLRRQCALALVRAVSADDENRARAHYLAHFGDEAPIWDVACPTHHERPDSLAQRNLAPIQSQAEPASASADAPAVPRWSVLANERAAQLPAALRQRWFQLVDLARQAVAAGEDDDWLYARIQAPVRHALLALGRALVEQNQLRAVEEILDLDLGTARALAGGESPSAGALQVQVERAQQAHRFARQHPPALPADSAAAGGDAGDAGDVESLAPANQVRGHGCGGHAVGLVVLRHGPSGAHPPPEAILLATSLLPTELPLLQVAALVTETGGPLGHVATQARERGLPAVVGAAGLLTLFRDGDLAIVDGATGIVRRGGPGL